MKKSFFIVLFLLSVSLSFALSTLPKYAYLRYNDNQKEVVILQQILNSDPDTKIADSGVGSPGRETWFFGKLTEEALKKFQNKYGLQATGEIDFKTWEKLNEYVNQKNNPKTTTKSTETKKQTEEKNIYLDEPSNNNPKDSNTQKSATSSDTFLDNSFLNNMLGKYSSLLSPSTYFTNTPQTSPTASTPYYNPQTGSYQSSPVSSSGGYAGLNAPGYYTQNLPFGGGDGYYGPAPATSRLANGDGNGNGFGQVLTTVYGHERNGANDREDNGITSCGCSSRKNGNCNKAVSLKKSLRISIFGNGRSYCGKEIEIVYPKKNTCGVYPLLETGPAEYLTQSMDLTGTTWNELDPGGRSGKEWMRFRVLKQGDKACEGYTRVDGKTN